MPEEKRYTLEEIKRAFWRTFHRSGEQWFDYLSTEESANFSTEEQWGEFLEALDEQVVILQMGIDAATPVTQDRTHA